MVSNHFQVQNQFKRSTQGLGHDQHGTDIVDTPEKKITSFIARFDPEGVLCVWVDVSGLDLEDVSWYRAI